ncbi:TPR-like protein [Nadsonia fulvescens var. elongata DSM 6958]|uniref:TPR-like protein n=1 Tax=Nadsonia fulvescens var. elongata DSM 6958 TaxID=857566 RepID=A0A1E3PHP7_9ASCO|nr:TPR-like protein [Nadsonia fulvescens var. elongata DSM 6958]
MRDLFNDPQALAKLAAHPKTKDFASDPSFIAKFKEIQANPMTGLTAIQSDERLRLAFAVILGIDNMMPEDGNPSAGQEKPRSATEPKAAEPKVEAPRVEEPIVEEETNEDAKLKAQADEFKQQGNVAYKSRKFDEAIELYNKAYATFNDITYLNNRAAAEYEKADYETCINTCLEAVAHGREIFVDYKILAKSFGRIGNAYLKMGEHAKAIEYFNKSLTEHRTPDILNRLRATEKDLKIQEAMSYIDPVKAEEAREEGNARFKESDWPGAVKAYSEMIKRAPEDARGYSNRAAALSKLMSFPEAVKDCQTAIAKDPKFIRAYIRMANAYFAMRDYSKCIDTLADAYELDTERKHTSEIEQLQYKAMSSRFQASDGETPEQTLERASRDPEIVAILQDPVMNSILSQARENPSALQDHMKNPQVAKKINLLIAAGIIRTR